MARFVDLASGHSLELPSQRATFGTASDNHIPMAQGFDLCPRHFQVTPVPGGMVLVDMTGQQATLVNNSPVSQTMLKNGDIVTAGKLSLRYECIPVPPPLPPDPNPAGNTLAPPMPCSAGEPGMPVMQRSIMPRSSSKAVAFEDGGTSSLPNVATALHLYRWMLPVLGLILWAGKWCYNIYSVKDGVAESENRAVAYALVETFREAREAKAPLIENVHDAGHAVRVLLRGVHGSGEYADIEFKVDITREAADDALDMLMWSESAGLTFKHEYRESSTSFEEEDDTTIDAGAEETDMTSLEDI